MHAEPTKEHEWLKRMLGTWDMESVIPGEGDQPSTTLRGVEQTRMLGELWVIAEGEGDMPGGGKGLSMITIGYDPSKGKFQSSWIGSMMHHMWVCYGDLDESGNKLTLEAEGPNFFDPNGGTALYRDVYEFTDNDTKVLTASYKKPDGSWESFMTATFRRRK